MHQYSPSECIDLSSPSQLQGSYRVLFMPLLIPYDSSDCSKLSLSVRSASCCYFLSAASSFLFTDPIWWPPGYQYYWKSAHAAPLCSLAKGQREPGRIGRLWLYQVRVPARFLWSPQLALNSYGQPHMHGPTNELWIDPCQYSHVAPTKQQQAESGIRHGMAS